MSYLYAESESGVVAHLRYFALTLAFVLLTIAPLYAALVLGYCALARRLVIPPSLVLWPAVSGLCCHAFPRILFGSFSEAVIGKVHPLTIALCALTIVFAVASTMSLVQVVRWSLRPDRPSLMSRLFPIACAVAFFSLTVWFGANGWIGIRTWAW